MPESHIKSVRTDDLDTNYEVTIKELKEGIDFNVRELAKVMCLVNIFTHPSERDLMSKKYAKQALMYSWTLKQLQLQVEHKKLEWKIMNMIREKKFNQRIKELFLKKYDALGLQLIDVWEEGVALDEMTESDYRESVDDIMKLRNLLHDE